MTSKKSDQPLLVPFQSEEFIPPVSRWTTLGGIVLVLTFSSAIAVAALTRFNVTVTAPATVRPVGEQRIVQASAGGTVASIEVKENQVVRKGDRIATLDSSSLQTRKSHLQVRLQHAQLQLNIIDDQLNILSTQIATESNLMSSNIAAAQAELSYSKQEVRERQIAAQAEVREAEATLELARTELELYQQLRKANIVPRLQVAQKEQAFRAAEARLERAKAALNPSEASVTISVERIAQAKARGQGNLAALSQEHKQLSQRRIEIQNQIGSDQQELQQVEINLTKGIFRAPVDGIILNLALRNTGQTATQGQTIAQIAPTKVPLVIKAQVAAQDIGRIALGQTVILRVSAFPYPDYGTLKGTVSAIAPDAANPQGTDTGVIASLFADRRGNFQTGQRLNEMVAARYEVTILPERLYFVKGDRRYLIQPGMEARADIVTREDTVLSFILRKARLLVDL